MVFVPRSDDEHIAGCRGDKLSRVLTRRLARMAGKTTAAIRTVLRWQVPEPTGGEWERRSNGGRRVAVSDVAVTDQHDPVTSSRRANTPPTYLAALVRGGFRSSRNHRKRPELANCFCLNDLGV